MAKEKEVSAMQSTLMSSMLKYTQQKFGDRVYVASGALKHLIGLPFDNLAQMWLFDSNVLLLGKSVGIAGAPMTNKSAFGYDIIKMFLKHGGSATLIENEGGKWSPVLLESIACADTGLENVLVTHSTSIEEAQSMMTGMLEQIKKLSNHNQLYLLLLDSLSGSDTQDNAEKQRSEGFAEARAYPAQAASWTRFFKTFSIDLMSWPINFVFVNHLKQSINFTGYGPPPEHTPGGDAQRFSSAWYIHINRMGKGEHKVELDNGKEIVNQVHEIRPLRFQMSKSSMGTENRSIMADFVFYMLPDGKQVSYFDWHGATAYLLNYFQNEKGTGVDKSALRDIVDVNVVSKRYSSKKLGVDGLTAASFGKLIDSNSKLLNELIGFLGIHRYTPYEGYTLPMSLPDEDKKKKDPKPVKAEKAEKDKPIALPPIGKDEL